ncbi:MAG: hypothetical protein ABEL76_07495, partial [Bradymonadaceae bacterium]
MRADPDTFVVLFPVDWHLDRSDEIERIHQTHWQEDLAIDADPLPEDEEATARGHLQLSDNASAEL